ncbi:hypothetical protein V6N11_073102 [Hibiscus sabdariffa]|uniref:Uncharacterized protein n=1 Tax=Hibiscus sabdariffa TaxID=183260 RepID=A0ABR2P938_9ROSI
MATNPSYLCEDQGYFHDDYNFVDTTHMSWEARMDAQCQEIEEISRRIENLIKYILNTLNNDPQQMTQVDYEIPNREEDGQGFGVNEQTAQNLSPIAQEYSLCDIEITLSSDTDDAWTKGKKKQCQVVTPWSDEQVFGTGEISAKLQIIFHEDSVPAG